MRYLLPITICLLLNGCARHSDRDWVLHEFNVPQDVELSVTSSPESDSNWADRKNLVLDATFKFTPTQLLDYKRTVENDKSDWHPLPIPDDLQKALRKQLNSPESSDAIRKATHGQYFFKSANGKNLLKTSKRDDWNPTTKLQDLELGILNSDSAELNVYVRQFY